MCSYIKDANGDVTQTEQEKAKCAMEAKMWDVARFQGMLAATRNWKKQGEDSLLGRVQSRDSALSEPWFQSSKTDLGCLASTNK